jgi:hypothetical protein
LRFLAKVDEVQANRFLGLGDLPVLVRATRLQFVHIGGDATIQVLHGDFDGTRQELSDPMDEVTLMSSPHELLFQEKFPELRKPQLLIRQ